MIRASCLNALAVLEVPFISLNLLTRGLKLGIPIGISVGYSSFRFRHSVGWALAVGVAAAALGATLQTFFEERSRRHLLRRDISVKDAPVKPTLVLACRASPSQVLQFAEQALGATGRRIRTTSFDDPSEVGVITKASFYSFRERIRIRVRALAADYCELEIRSVPWIDTTTVDYGVNYSNVYLLSRYIKERLGDGAVIRETWDDLDDPPYSHPP